MSRKNNININKDLKSATRQIVDKKIIWYLIAASGIMIAAFVMDLLQGAKIGIYEFIRIRLARIGPDLLADVREIKYMLSESLEQLFDIIITLDTILAAAVIFFYSVQDGRKEGIPHRTIMAYTFGSFTVPILFIVIMLMLPLNFFAIAVNLRWFAWAGVIFTYATQIIIIILILLSTSYQYSARQTHEYVHPFIHVMDVF